MPDMCVVFDLDDTLYLERDYVRSGFRHVGLWAKKELGIPDFSDRAWELFEAGCRGKIFDQILQESRIRWDRSTMEQLLAIYRSHYPEIRLLPDALVCLQALHGKAPLAILSDGPPEAQRNKVAALRLKQWFDAIFLTAEWGFEYAKPSPVAFQLAQKQFGCEAELCYYIADNSLKDFIAPKKLGWRTVRVRRQRGLYSEADANGKFAADYEFRDLCGLPTLLQETLSLQL